MVPAYVGDGPLFFSHEYVSFQFQVCKEEINKRSLVSRDTSAWFELAQLQENQSGPVSEGEKSPGTIHLPCNKTFDQ